MQESNKRLEAETKQKELERKLREKAEQREVRLRKSHQKEVAFLRKELARALENKSEPGPVTSSGASGSISRGSPLESPDFSVNQKRSFKEDKSTKEIERRGKARKTNN